MRETQRKRKEIGHGKVYQQVPVERDANVFFSLAEGSGDRNRPRRSLQPMVRPRRRGGSGYRRAGADHAAGDDQAVFPDGPQTDRPRDRNAFALGQSSARVVRSRGAGGELEEAATDLEKPAEGRPQRRTDAGAARSVRHGVALSGSAPKPDRAVTPGTGASARRAGDRSDSRGQPPSRCRETIRHEAAQLLTGGIGQESTGSDSAGAANGDAPTARSDQDAIDTDLPVRSSDRTSGRKRVRNLTSAATDQRRGSADRTGIHVDAQRCQPISAEPERRSVARTHTGAARLE